MNRPSAATLARAWRFLSPALAVGLLVTVGWLAWAALPPGKTLDAVRSWPALVGAGVSYLLVLFLLPLIWAGLLRAQLPEPAFGQSGPDITDLYAAYSRSWLARYIPGRVWTYGGRALLAARLGVPLGPVARSMVQEILFSYGMLTILGAGFLVWVAAGPAPGIVALAAGTLALGLVMRLLGRAAGPSRLTRLLPARLRSLAAETQSRPQPIVWPIAAYAGHGALNLVFFVLVALSFVPLPPLDILQIAGAWGLAMTLGWLAFLAPGGLGARDGVALLFLAPLVDTPTAALIVAAARLLGVILDFVFVGLAEVALLVCRLRQPTAPVTELAPE
jgi:glycosyltransferase 2 family protein